VQSMKNVRAKKHLGQHFLKDLTVAQQTADLAKKSGLNQWLEIGPGMGVLTQYLLHSDINLKAIDLDQESVEYLHKNYPDLDVVYGDFLKQPIHTWFDGEFGIIGNFPYNISSQIMFKTLENRDIITIFCGMFQLEVAQRIVSPSGNKTYGILSVLVQCFYDVTIEIKIPPGAFAPPPKVHSAVILAKRNERSLDVDESLFFDVVKTAFQQRRKTLSNALKKFNIPKDLVLQNPMFKLRAERLTVDDFIELTRFIAQHRT